MKSLIIDNYDSFTFNLYQMIAKINNELPIVVKNNQIELSELENLAVDNIIISPGPGHPDKIEDFGICKEIILHSNLPILGVCLGHQGIYSAFGGVVARANFPMHGRQSVIAHNQDRLFDNIPTPFHVIRYHSLVAQGEIPPDLEVISRSTDNLIMAIKHKKRPIWGIQFHPESISSEYGHQLLENFKNMTVEYLRSNRVTAFPPKLAKTTSNKPFTHELFVKKIALHSNPEKLFEKIFGEDKTAAWLDSSMLHQATNQFSILGSLNGPLSYQIKYNVNTKELQILKDKLVTSKKMSIFDFLKEELQKFSVKTPSLPFDFNCGFIGYFGYELKSETMKMNNNFIFELPDAQFIFLDRALVIDHENQSCYLLCLSSLNGEQDAHQWFDEVVAKLENCDYRQRPSKGYQNLQFSHDKKHYLRSIDQCLEHIRNGESYEVCLTNQLKINAEVDALHYYSLLRKRNPAPYSAFLKFDDCAVACSSMERFIKLNKERQVETKPIKGTLPRGKTLTEDQQLIFQLSNDEKFTSENLMIVDLLRNDLGAVCKIGSITVPHLMQVESYQTVHQLVSTIRGELLDDLTAVDCIQHCFPGGSMTGAPKLRTLELLDTMETEARGIYSGTIGYLALNGTADFNIVIRTAVITADTFTVGVGGAIVALSDPGEEYEEMLLKSRSLFDALSLVE